MKGAMLGKKQTRTHIGMGIAHLCVSGNCAKQPAYCNELEEGTAMQKTQNDNVYLQANGQ